MGTVSSHPVLNERKPRPVLRSEITDGLPLDGLARLARGSTGAISAAFYLSSDGSAPRLVGTTSGADSTGPIPTPVVTAIATRKRTILQLPGGGRQLAHPVSEADDGPVVGVISLRLAEDFDTDTLPLQLCDISRLLLSETGEGDEGGRVAMAEQEILRSQRRYRELAETVSSGVALISLDGIIREVNGVAAEILGDEPARILGRVFREFVAPEDLDKAESEFEARLQGSTEKRQSEFRIIRPSGERRLLQVWSSPMMGESSVIGVYFAARDISDERSRESQLRRAERLASIAPLLSGVCHELNNPLTSIKSFAELLLLDDRPPEDREALEIVIREASRAARIVTDLRLVARQTQDENASTAVVDVNELVRNACASLAAECSAGSIELRAELASRLPPLLGVGSQIERVIVQLLSNAARALSGRPEPRLIRVQTCGGDDGISICVRDTGPGIAPEHVDHIFDPFWTTRTTGEGTGLGLSLVHSIVSDHEGTIRVEAGWGSGAAFTIDFPISSEPRRVAPDPPGRSPARTPLRILVVDDEGPIRFSLARYMERRGHTVRDAEEGRQALTLLDDPNELPFDIIVADLRMPGLGGEELYHRLRQRGEGLEERLIFITGDAESPDATRILDEAGVPVVLKPFELAEIAQIIETQADFCTA